MKCFYVYNTLYTLWCIHNCKWAEENLVKRKICQTLVSRRFSSNIFRKVATRPPTNSLAKKIRAKREGQRKPYSEKHYRIITRDVINSWKRRREQKSALPVCYIRGFLRIHTQICTWDILFEIIALILYCIYTYIFFLFKSKAEWREKEN